MPYYQPASRSGKIILIVILIIIAIPILLFALFILMINRDNISHAAYEPDTTENILEYIHGEILRETGDNVVLEIIAKEPIKECVHRIDGCGRYAEIDNAYKYQLQATNMDDPSVQAIINFSDSYITNGRQITPRYLDYKEYHALSILAKIKAALATALDDTSYHVRESEISESTVSRDKTMAGISVDILSDDYDALDIFLANIHRINQEFNSDHIISFKINHFRDNLLYNRLGEVNGADIETIKSSNGYSRYVMESSDPGGYDSIFFRYSNSCHYSNDQYTNVECSALRGYRDGLSFDD